VDGSCQFTANGYRIWSEQEKADLIEFYPKGGTVAVAPKMPDRTRAAINRQASKMHLHAPHVPPRPPSVHQPCPHTDEQIRRFYSAPIKRGSQRPFAKSIGKPPWYVRRRASELGVIVPRLRELPWSKEEIRILEANAGLGPVAVRKRLNRAGFIRSATGIEIKRKRLGLHAADERELAGIYTAKAIADGVGCNLTTVLRWINLGQLPASRRNGVDTASAHWDIHKKDFQRFLATYHQAIDLRKVDREWFFHMAFGDLL